MLIASLMMLGTIQRALLNLEAARAAHLEASAIDQTMASQPFAASAFAELCADEALAGQWNEAHTYALQTLATRDDNLLYASFTRWQLIEVLLQRGDRDRADEELRRFGARARDNRRYHIPYLRALAALAQSEEDLSQAIVHLEAAGALADEIGLPGEQWQIAAALGALHRSCGDTDQAHQAFARASAIRRA